jgi:hypothetical protein
MEYYKCPIEDLIREARRRGYTRFGTSDEISEVLQRDEEARGSDATTVGTLVQSSYGPRELNLAHTAEFGKSVLASQLVNESRHMRGSHWEDREADPDQRSFIGR